MTKCICISRGIILVFLFFSISCIGDKGSKVELKTMNEVDESVIELENKINLSGDTNAYYKLVVISIEDPNRGLFYNSLIMANKFKYPVAFYYVYTILAYDKYHRLIIDSLDDDTRLLALKYLIKGTQLEDDCSTSELEILMKRRVKYVHKEENGEYIIKPHYQ
jgi:hypothetical protein